MSKAKTKKIDALLSDLFSAKEETVLKALEKVPEEGNSKLIIPLLKAFKEWEGSPQIQSKVESILKQLKSESAVPELITALEDPDFEDQRALIISAFWNSGIFPENDVDVLVRQAIRGDYMVALEAITVIENIEAEMDPDMLQDAIFDLDEALDSEEMEHTPLLIELKKLHTQLYNI
jgi:HEAT repeat protein